MEAVFVLGMLPLQVPGDSGQSRWVLRAYRSPLGAVLDSCPGLRGFGSFKPLGVCILDSPGMDELVIASSQNRPSREVNSDFVFGSLHLTVADPVITRARSRKHVDVFGSSGVIRSNACVCAKPSDWFRLSDRGISGTSIAVRQPDRRSKPRNSVALSRLLMLQTPSATFGIENAVENKHTSGNRQSMCRW